MIVQPWLAPLSSSLPNLDRRGGALFYGWKLLFVFWLVLLVAAAFPLYGGGVMNAYMAAELQMDRSVVGLPMSVYQFMFGLGAPVVGMIVDRYGVRATLAGGALLIAVAALLMGFVVSSAVAAIVVFGLVLGLGGAAAGGITTQAGVARWFTRRRALAIAILMSAPGTGGFIVAPLINKVIVACDGNWRAGWWLTACVALSAGAIALLFVRERPSDVGQQPDGLAADTGAPGQASASARTLRSFITTEEWTRGEVLRSRAFWQMLIAAFGVNMGYTLYFAVGVLHLQDLGHPKSVGAWALSAFGISTLLGKLALGALGDRFDPRFVWASTAAAFGIGLIVMSGAASDAKLFTCIVLLGFGFGGGMASMFAVLSNYYGPKVFPSVAGMAVAITTCAGALSPAIAGLLHTQSGSYRPAFLAIAFWCMAGAVLIALTFQPRRGVAGQSSAVSSSRLSGA
jgi:MFS family permease